MGNEALPSRLSPEDEETFRELVKSGYIVTSPKDTTYNCIAHAVGDHSRSWDPTGFPSPGYFWPPGVSRGSSPDDLRGLFESLGYELCAGGEVEGGFEKVVLYVDEYGDWTHAAKQVIAESGAWWSSKLGNLEDISHKSANCFGDMSYGKVVYYMKRPLQ